MTILEKPSSILLRSLFYRDGGLIIPPVSQVSWGAGDIVDAGTKMVDEVDVVGLVVSPIW